MSQSSGNCKYGWRGQGTDVSVLTHTLSPPEQKNSGVNSPLNSHQAQLPI